MSTPVEFGGIDNSKLAALVFELASQLHIERAQRLALEAALLGRGTLSEADIEAARSNAAFRRTAAEAADLAVRQLLRVLSESSDDRAPLRGEAPAPERGDS